MKMNRESTRPLVGANLSHARRRGGDAIAPPSHDDIARRAYEIYAGKGFRPGQCEQNWLQAERELLASPRSQAHTQQPAAAIEVTTDDINMDASDLGSSHLNLSSIGTDRGNVR